MLNITKVYDADGKASTNVKAHAPEVLDPNVDMRQVTRKRVLRAVQAELGRHLDPDMERRLSSWLLALLFLRESDPVALRAALRDLTHEVLTPHLLDMLLELPPVQAADILLAFVSVQQLGDATDARLLARASLGIQHLRRVEPPALSFALLAALSASGEAQRRLAASHGRSLACTSVRPPPSVSELERWVRERPP